eukprot:EG_transcript_7893
MVQAKHSPATDVPGAADQHWNVATATPAAGNPAAVVPWVTEEVQAEEEESDDEGLCDMASPYTAVGQLQGAIRQCMTTMQFDEAAKLQNRLTARRARDALKGRPQRHTLGPKFDRAAKLRDRICALHDPVELVAPEVAEKPRRTEPQKAKQEAGKATPQAKTTTAKARKQAVKAPNKADVRRKTVLVSGLLKKTSKAMLQAVFPTALHVKVKAQGTGELVFDTVQTAVAQAAKGGVEVGGRVVRLRMAVDPKWTARDRQVFVGGLPLTITQTALASHFPTAKAVELRQLKSQAYAFVSFPTASEAAATAARATWKVDGHATAHLCMADGKAAYEAEQEERQQRTARVGPLPLATERAAVARSFPAAAEVRLRQLKDQAFALVEFPTVEAMSAAASPGTVKLNGCTIPVRQGGGEMKRANEREREERNRRTLFVGSLPVTFSWADLARYFPTAERVELLQSKKRACAFVVFPTKEAAEACVAQTTLVVGGHSADLRMAGDRGDRQR